MWKNNWRWRTVGVLLLAVLIVVTLVSYGDELSSIQAASSSGEPVVTLVPPAKAERGKVITVHLVVREAQNLAGFQSTIAYDQAQLRLTGATVSSDLERSGRDVLSLGPIRRNGAVALGAATCPAADCSTLRPTRLQLFTRQQQGGVGDFELATLEFYTLVPGDHLLTLNDVQLVDPAGNPTSVRVADDVVLRVQ